MRIAITGTTGRLGGALAKAWSADHEIIELPRARFDLSKPDSLEAELDAIAAESGLDALLNPAAITSVDACEGKGQNLAQVVNAEAPEVMARWAARNGVRFVHFSTDYVFGGQQAGPRKEDDPTEPIQVYGTTKLAGEQAVLEVDDGALVIRVSWVFGPEKDSFLESAIRRAKTEQNAGAIADKWSLPLFTAEAVPAIAELLVHPKARGVVHLAQSGEPCSWRDWAQCGIDALAERGQEFSTRSLVPQQVAEVPFFTAARPIHTALGTAQLESLLGRRLNPWRKAVKDYALECLA